MIRFDPGKYLAARVVPRRLEQADISTVYVQHFKCNLGMIRSHYPVTNNWLKNLYYNVPGFRETTDFKHIKENVSCNFVSIEQRHVKIDLHTAVYEEPL